MTLSKEIKRNELKNEWELYRAGPNDLAESQSIVCSQCTSSSLRFPLFLGQLKTPTTVEVIFCSDCMLSIGFTKEELNNLPKSVVTK